MLWKTTEYAGWGRVHTATGQVARPERVSNLVAALKETPAPAIGMCRSYGDASLNDGGAAIDMTRLDRIIGFDPDSGTLEVEGGCQIGELARLFAPRGWLPAVMPGTGFATVAGCIANDVHGKNHHGNGSFGQHVISLVLMTPSGKKVIGPKKSAKLFQATVGGLGQTGIIVSVKLQMLPCKGDVMMVTERRAESYEDFLTLLDNSTATYSVGWIDATAKGNNLGRGILEEAETGSGLMPAQKKPKSVPFNAPAFALSKPIVKAFNAAYYRRVPESGRTSVKPINDFFFPLDAIHDWNKLYGKRGFHQFQCVVPIEKAAALREMLELIARSGLASPLAVLKRMGAGRAGNMSFPMEGYTLAVDFPNRPQAEILISRLEEMTQLAGGRLYLAKDSLATGARIKSMYPEHAAWVDEVEKADPEGQFATDLIRRLDLRTTL
ncbi:FAD-dependent oxidoreductase [Pseudohalocynthiibacter aestuariivivens]|jgi:decaprenylphospho-beta-D-ribofuranose 2-oxidase|uniref:FAD-dependent oxidoreductase n=1 Tax=Pseudohalocynthiibacter aestuariivivens TaxID=1591409 RepID=A0ABV5JEF7_9RHOB|nr:MULTISPECIES: FAD-binding oxidoreductase [Pseudohalocynthiibacter]MBS9718692.1 FAD-binding oxidoreductase [Pseudohalocynthiibacter aestuariivivens]MCK0104168.1 FAD-binding oxidoreductase [Pseudohalocynthiibacter sp. F2068]